MTTTEKKALDPDWTLDAHYDGFSFLYNHSDDLCVTWSPSDRCWYLSECQMAFGDTIPWEGEETLREILDEASRRAEEWFKYWANTGETRPSDPAISRK